MSIRAGDQPKKGTPKPPLPPLLHSEGQKRDPDKGNPQFQKWWDRHMETSKPFHPSLPAQELKGIALAAWKAGVKPEQLNVLFGNKAENLFAANAAGGPGQPSPYLEYFKTHLDQAVALIAYLVSDKPIHGTGNDTAFMEAFPGLRESYLDQLGLVEVAGPGGGTTIRDAANPRLTPYQADQERFRDANPVAPAPAVPGGPTNFDPYAAAPIGSRRGEGPGGREPHFFSPAATGFSAPDGFAQVQEGLANTYIQAVSAGDVEGAANAHQALSQHSEFVDLYHRVRNLGQPSFKPIQTQSFSAEDMQTS